MYIVLWFGPRGFTTLPTAKTPVSLKLYCTFISKDDLFEIFVLVCSVALGPCQSLLFVLRTNELAVAAATKSPANQSATPKNRPQRCDSHG